MRKLMTRLLRDEEGQDLVEYALLIAVIALIVAAAVPPLGTAIRQIFERAVDCVDGCA